MLVIRMPRYKGGHVEIGDCGNQRSRRSVDFGNQEIASILQRAQDFAMTAGWHGADLNGKLGFLVDIIGGSFAELLVIWRNWGLRFSYDMFFN